jgi:hypothetical protein
VIDSIDDTERKRQEAINEVIYTEQKFASDLEYIRDVSENFLFSPLFPMTLGGLRLTLAGRNYMKVWIKPLMTESIIDEPRREYFLQQIFWNLNEIHAGSQQLCVALKHRQKQQYVVDSIGDIFLGHVPNFEEFVNYGAHQVYGYHAFELERRTNPAFSKFVDVRPFVAFFLSFVCPSQLCRLTPSCETQKGTGELT